MRSNRTTCPSLICGLVASGFLVLGSSGCRREAEAQVSPAIQDPLGPINCFRLVDAAQLSGQSALELCSGALTDAPGRCYVESVDRFHELSTQQIMNLCNRAVSTGPVDCYDHLARTGKLTESQIIGYCTTTCGVGPPPAEASSPACLASAIAYTDLSLQSAGELCLASISTDPVQCFLAGQDLHKVADSSLIQICAQSRRCQYYNAPPVY